MRGRDEARAIVAAVDLKIRKSARETAPRVSRGISTPNVHNFPCKLDSLPITVRAMLSRRHISRIISSFSTLRRNLPRISALRARQIGAQGSAVLHPPVSRGRVRWSKRD